MLHCPAVLLAHSTTFLAFSNVQGNARPASADAARKRKVISPAGKSGPAAKRATTAGVAAKTAAAPSGRPASAAAPADENEWDAVAAEMGWTPADCLSHKLAFAKRATDKSKVGGRRP